HYIRQYACQGIKTEQVAAHIGLSRSSLETYFRRELQRTVHDEILHFKLAHARELLRAGQMTGAEVATLSGFGSVQYLNAVFKRELACTPREYRERNAHGNEKSPDLANGA
ncbi:MAG: AraC family transcriptional regulator, partial [Burkholderiales bacterium]